MFPLAFTVARVDNPETLRVPLEDTVAAIKLPEIDAFFRLVDVTDAPKVTIPVPAANVDATSTAYE